LTHRFTVSKSCNSVSANHKGNATTTNMMGSSSTGSSTKTINAAITFYEGPSSPNVKRIISPVIVDTGHARKYFIIDSLCTHMRPASPSTAVRMLNGTHIQSTQTGLFDLPNLPEAAGQAHIFHTLSSSSLLSEAALSEHEVHIKRHGRTILTGHRSKHGLWMIDVPTPPNTLVVLLDSESVTDCIPQPSPVPTANALLLDLKAVADCLAFLHAAPASLLTFEPGVKPSTTVTYSSGLA
jgi:hypothetical protein